MAERDTSHERPGRTSTWSTPEPAKGMCAREWAIAYRFREPVDYGIPELPEWTVTIEEGGVAFGDGDGEPFIRADRPVQVRR